MEYNPKWVVVSNDDMKKIDDISLLRYELERTNLNNAVAFYPFPKKYVTVYSKLAEPTKIHNLLVSVLTGKKMNWIGIEKKFEIKLKGAPISGLIALLYKKGKKFINFVSFAIFSFEFAKKFGGNLFDDTYVNAAEDTDLSMRVEFDYKALIINYKIGAFKGSTIGINSVRRYKEIPSNAYLNWKISSNLIHIPKRK